MFTFVGFPLVNTIFCIIGGFTEVLWLVALAQILLLLGWIGIYIMGKKQVQSRNNHKPKH